MEKYPVLDVFTFSRSYTEYHE